MISRIFGPKYKSYLGSEKKKMISKNIDNIFFYLLDSMTDLLTSKISFQKDMKRKELHFPKTRSQRIRFLNLSKAASSVALWAASKQ